MDQRRNYDWVQAIQASREREGRVLHDEGEVRMDNEGKIFAIIFIFCFVSTMFVYIDGNLKSIELQNQTSDAISNDLGLRIDTVFASYDGIWVAWFTEDSERVQFVKVSQVDGEWAAVHVINFVKPIPPLPICEFRLMGTISMTGD